MEKKIQNMIHYQKSSMQMMLIEYLDLYISVKQNKAIFKNGFYRKNKIVLKQKILIIKESFI
jgi:L-fucose mutarotase/ribose pyranase (RbsD/FucU family)